MRYVIGLFLVGLMGWYLTGAAEAQRPDYLPPESTMTDEGEQTLGGVKVVRDEGLNAQEEKLIETLDRLNREARKTDPETPEGKKLRARIREIEKKLEMVRRRMYQQQDAPDIGEELRQQMESLRRLEKERPDSPETRQVRERIARLRERMHEARSRRTESSPRKPMNRERQELRIFRLKYVPVEHAVRIVKPFLGERSIVVGDPRTNTLLIRVGIHFFKDVEKILDHIDVPEQPIRGYAEREEHRPERQEHRMMPKEHWPEQEGYGAEWQEHHAEPEKRCAEQQEPCEEKRCEKEHRGEERREEERRGDEPAMQSESK